MGMVNLLHSGKRSASVDASCYVKRIGCIVDIKEALKITGWKLCEFKSDGDDDCNCCNKPIKKGANVYYERTCYEVDDGEYYCESCTIETPARWEKENDGWDDYVALSVHAQIVKCLRFQEANL